MRFEILGVPVNGEKEYRASMWNFRREKVEAACYRRKIPDRGLYLGSPTSYEDAEGCVGFGVFAAVRFKKKFVPIGPS